MFYWEIYKLLNPDLNFNSPEDYLRHFLEKGRYEGRRFMVEQFTPFFQTFIYKHNYLDLRNFSIEKCQEHWITRGYYENRIANRLIKPDYFYEKNIKIPNKLYDFIDRLFYINLEKREDRNKSICNELKNIDFPEDKIERFNAIFNKKGYLGCSQSHIKCLELAIERNYNCIMVVEDDLIFKKNFQYLVSCFNMIKDIDFKMILLTGNIKNIGHISEQLYQAIDVKTTAGYIINKSYYKKCLENFKNTYNKLVETDNYMEYAIDIGWKKLQIEDKWIIFYPTLGYQAISYSDIENKIVNYGDYC